MASDPLLVSVRLHDTGHTVVSLQCPCSPFVMPCRANHDRSCHLNTALEHGATTAEMTIPSVQVCCCYANQHVLDLVLALATCLRTSEFLNRPLRPSSRSGCWLAGGQAGAGPGAAGGGGARDGVEPAGLLARVRGVLAVQPRHGQLQVLRGRAAAVPHGLPLHVQGQVLPGALQLADRRDEATASGQRTKYELSRAGE